MKHILILFFLALSSCVTVYRYDIKCEHEPYNDVILFDKPWEPYTPKRHDFEPFDCGILKFPNNADTGMVLMWDTISIDTSGLIWTK